MQSTITEFSRAIMSEAAPNLSNLGDSFRVVDQRRNREVYTFPVPDKAQADVGVASLGLVKLTLDEEDRAYESMKGTSVGAAIRMKLALARASLQEINGKPIAAIDEKRDMALDGLSPKARELLVLAYAKLHAVEQDLSASFLAGMTVGVK